MVWTARCRDKDREKGRASWCQVGLPAQSLPRRRFRRALHAFICTFCMRMCIYVYVRMCADMMYIYICMCVCICTSIRLYTCVCVFVCIFVHRLWVLVSVLQRTVSCMRMCFRVHMHAYTYVCRYIYMYIFFAMSVTCTLQVLWALVHGRVCMLHRCVFTPTYISAKTTWVLDVSPCVERTPGGPEESRSTKAQYTCRPYRCTQYICLNICCAAGFDDLG